MGWTDKIGDAWDATKGGIGATWTFVNDTSPLEAMGLDSADKAIRNVAEPATAPARWAGETAFKGAMGGFEDAARIIGTPFKYAGRGISTATQVAGQAHAQEKGQLLFSQDAWDQAWERSKEISPGQAFMTNVAGDLATAPEPIQASTGWLTQGYTPDAADRFSPEQAEQRHDYFYNTPAGRFSSGSVDLWLNFVADPVGVVAGGASKIARERTLIASPGDAGGGKLDIAGKLGIKGPDAPDRTLIIDESIGYSNGKTKAEKRAGRQLKNLYLKTDGLSAAEMANLPQFRNTADSGIMSYFFEKANQLYPADIEARHGLKADIMGVAIGNPESIQRIQDFDTGLAFELQRAGSTLVPVNTVANFSWSNAGKDLLDKYNMTALPLSNEEKITRLEAERARLGRLLELDSGYNQTGATLGQATAAKYRNARLNETIIPNGMFGRPTRAVIGGTSTRVPGFVHVKDTNRGYKDMQSLVTNMRYTPIARKKELLTKFAAAANDGERRNIVDEIELQMFDDAAKQYGMKTDAAREMLKAVSERRGAYMESLSTKLYSATDGDRLISHIDPEDDIEDVFSKPLLQTQIESAHAVTDPRVLHRALDKGTNRRLLEAWTENRIAKRTGTKVADMTDATSDLLDDFATMVTRPWKDLMLMRGAYPLRIQIDTQMRLMAYLGLTQYMLEGGNAFKGLGKYALSVKDETVNKELKAGRLTIGRKTEFMGEEITPARSDDEIARAIGAYRSTGGSMADIGNDVQQQVIRGYRASGNFERISTKDQFWFGHWKRAIQQIQGSPTAKQALTTPDVEDLKAWLATNAEGRKEFSNFAAGRSVESWLGLVSAHANSYVPDGDIRRYVLRGGREGMDKDELAIRNADMKKAREDAAMFTQRRQEAFQRKQDKALEIQNYRPMVKQAKDELIRASALPGRGRRPKPRTLPGGQVQNMSDADYKKYMVSDAKQRFDDSVAEYKRMRLEHKDLVGKHVKAVDRSKVAAATLNNANTRKGEMVRNHALGQTPDESIPGSIKSWGDVEKYFESVEGQAKRMDVHGESYSPISTKGGVLLQKLGQKRSAFYRIFADMPETVIGRSPLYSFTYKRYMRDALSKIEEGTVDSVRLERIRRGADKAARKEIANVLFDSSNMSNLSHTMRHLSPFFSAWEDTMKKWGSLVSDNPAIGTTLAKAYFAPDNAGLVTDSEGNRLDKWGNLIDPETGEIMKKPKDYRGEGQYITVPASWVPNSISRGSFTINKASANILFQGDPPWLPGAGPLVQVPTNEISKRMFPDEVDNNPLLKYILPYGNQDLGESVAPAYVRQLRNAFGDTQDHASTFAMLYAQEQTKFDNGERSTAPTTKEIEKATRNWFILRAGISFQSPVSMMPRPEYQLYIDKAHQYKAQYKENWQEKFYDDFPQYFKMSISLSSNETGLVASPQVYEALKDKKVREAIAQNPEYGWFLLGDNNMGNFDPGVYKWMQGNDAAPGLKFLERKTPQEAITDSEVQTGWVQYTKGMALLDEMLEKRGLYSYELKAAADLKEMKNTFIDSIAENNKSWWYAFNQRNDTKVQELFDVAQKNWAANPRFAQQNGQKQLQQYMEAREYVSIILQSRPVTSLDNPQNEDIAQVWGQYINSLKVNSPAFSVIYDRVLEGDDINKALISSGPATNEEVE